MSAQAHRESGAIWMGMAFDHLLLGDGTDHEVIMKCYRGVEAALKALFEGKNGTPAPHASLVRLAQLSCRMGTQEEHLVRFLEKFSHWDPRDSARREREGIDTDRTHEIFYETREFVARLLPARQSSKDSQEEHL